MANQTIEDYITSVSHQGGIVCMGEIEIKMHPDLIPAFLKEVKSPVGIGSWLLAHSGIEIETQQVSMADIPPEMIQEPGAGNTVKSFPLNPHSPFAAGLPPVAATGTQPRFVGEGQPPAPVPQPPPIQWEGELFSGQPQPAPAPAQPQGWNQAAGWQQPQPQQQPQQGWIQPDGHWVVYGPPHDCAHFFYHQVNGDRQACRNALAAPVKGQKNTIGQLEKADIAICRDCAKTVGLR